MGLANDNTTVDTVAGQGQNDGDSIVFAPGLAGGTINLAMALGELSIVDDVAIDGDAGTMGAMRITIDAGQNSRIFVVNVTAGVFGGVDLVTLNNLVVTNGNTAGDGGGIHTSSDLTLDNSDVTNSTAAINGGGIFSDETVNVNNSTISNNTTGASGGGVFLAMGGTLEFADSTLMNNTATGTGGGIQNNSELTLSGTAITLDINDSDTISGTGNVTSSPTGTVTFATGTLSTHTGTTTLTSGTTFINGTIDDNATPGNNSAGTVTVQSGATLGGIGTIDAAIDVESGGIVAPGAVFQTADQLIVDASTISGNTAVFGVGVVGMDSLGHQCRRCGLVRRSHATLGLGI